MRILIRVHSITTGPCHKQHVTLVRVPDRVFQSLRISASTPAVAQNLSTIVNSINNGINRIISRTVSRIIQELDRHDPYCMVHSHHACSIVAYCTYRAHTMRTMGITIHWICIIIGKVVTIDVVYIPIPIIVKTITRDFPLVHPYVRSQIQMSIVHSRVDHRHHHITASRKPIPRLRRVNIRIRESACLTFVVQSPQIVKPRIIRNTNRLPHIIGLRIFDVRIP